MVYLSCSYPSSYSYFLSSNGAGMTKKQMNMGNRLYYTDPIKALYMMGAFGVKFEYEIDKITPLEHLTGILELLGKIFIAKESESIFDPKAGDVSDEGNIFNINIDYPDSKYTGAWEEHCDSHAHNPDYDEIIMRDNKHFFMPEHKEKTTNTTLN